MLYERLKKLKKVPKSAGIGFGPEPEGSRRELLNYIRLSVNGHAHNNHKTAPILGRIGSRNYTNYRTPQGWINYTPYSAKNALSIFNNDE